MNKEFDLYMELVGDQPRAKTKWGRSRFERTTRHRQDRGFRCAHCQGYVYTESIISGVQNRNHCPYCLWSRHLDLYEAGDRLAACKAKMRPIGLTLKNVRKKYQTAKHGELMLIHQCVDCGHVSINRIATDDAPETVFEVFEGSFELDTLTRIQLEEEGIKALETADINIVRTQLFGGHLSDNRREIVGQASSSPDSVWL
jgi:CRISPR/Cas system CSM-associated protein Csm3 (group 7 of RAMP superfamily)